LWMKKGSKVVVVKHLFLFIVHDGFGFHDGWVAMGFVTAMGHP